MHIFLRDDKALSHIKTQLSARGDSEVSLILILENGEKEVEMKLPGRFKTSPQLAGALRVVPGVSHVELV
jgi:DNA polymerase-3 subunit alpha